MSGVERVRRVNELLQREISEYVERYISPVAGCLITITRVKTAPDLHDAIVFVSFLGGTQRVQDKAMRLIQDHRNDMQKTINRNIKIKFTPRLDIRRDDSLAEGDRILGLLDDLGV